MNSNESNLTAVEEELLTALSEDVLGHYDYIEKLVLEPCKHIAYDHGGCPAMIYPDEWKQIGMEDVMCSDCPKDNFPNIRECKANCWKIFFILCNFRGINLKRKQITSEMDITITALRNACKLIARDHDCPKMLYGNTLPAECWMMCKTCEHKATRAEEIKRDTNCWVAYLYSCANNDIEASV